MVPSSLARLLAPLLLLGACSSPEKEPAPEPADTASPVDSGAPPDTDEPIDSGDSGESGDTGEPEAIFACPPVYTLPGQALLDATAYREGEVAAYRWSILESPALGGPPTEPSATTRTVSYPLFTPGQWTVGLEVEDADGTVLAADSCTFEAVPSDALFVGLWWDTVNSDLDLHLTHNDAPFFEDPGDCTWCNREPAWDGGDPTLLLDNATGYGPEIIAIPSELVGSYGVGVHYFDDKGGGSSTATVQVWVEGERVYEGSASMEDRHMWSVGSLSVADLSFTESGSPPARWEGETRCEEPE